MKPNSVQRKLIISLVVLFTVALKAQLYTPVYVCGMHGEIYKNKCYICDANLYDDRTHEALICLECASKKYATVCDACNTEDLSGGMVYLCAKCYKAYGGKCIKCGKVVDPSRVSGGGVPVKTDQMNIRVHINDDSLYKKYAALYENGQKNLSQRNYEEALKDYKACYEILKDEYGACNIGWVYASMKKYKEAEEHFEKAIQLNPNSSLGYEGMGICLSYELKKEEALPYLKKAIGLGSSDYMTYFVMGYICNVENKLNEAISYFKKSIELNNLNSRAYVELARTYSALNNSEESEKYCRQALSLAPEDATANAILGHHLYIKVYNGKPGSEEWKTNLQEAYKILKTCIETFENDMSLQYKLGYVSRRLGKFDEAEVRLNKSLQIKSDDPDVLVESADMYFFDLQKYQQALVLYKRINQLLPNEAGVCLRVGQCNYVSGAFADAEPSFKKAVEIDPNNPEFVVWLALTQAHQNKKNSAEENADRALTLNSTNNLDIVYNAGCVYAIINKVDKAVSSLEKVLDTGVIKSDRLLSDNELESIKDTPQFKSLVEKYK